MTVHKGKINLTRRGFMGVVAGGAVAGLVHPARLFAKKRTVLLPEPSKWGKISLRDALKRRRSLRSFSEKGLSRETLSDLLWAAFGINRPDSGKRTAPSAMNWQDIAIYIVKADGLYIYDAVAHGLEQIINDDIRQLTGKQEFVKKAPVNLVYVSDFSKISKATDDRKMFYSAANTGFISQNVYLFCAAQGLDTVVRDYIDRPALAKAMNLRKDQKIILAQTVGYPKE